MIKDLKYATHGNTAHFHYYLLSLFINNKENIDVFANILYQVNYKNKYKYT